MCLLSLTHPLPHEAHLLHQELLEILRGLGQPRPAVIKVATILKNPRHVTDKCCQVLVIS